MVELAKKITYTCNCVYEFSLDTNYGRGGVTKVDFCDKHLDDYLTFYELDSTVGKYWDFVSSRQRFKEMRDTRKKRHE